MCIAALIALHASPSLAQDLRDSQVLLPSGEKCSTLAMNGTGSRRDFSFAMPCATRAEGGSHSCCSYRGNGCSSCCYRGYMNADCCPCSKFTDTDSDGVMDLADPDSDADGSLDAKESTGACCSCKPKQKSRARRLASKDVFGLEEVDLSKLDSAPNTGEVRRQLGHYDSRIASGECEIRGYTHASCADPSTGRLARPCNDPTDFRFRLRFPLIWCYADAEQGWYQKGDSEEGHTPYCTDCRNGQIIGPTGEKCSTLAMIGTRSRRDFLFAMPCATRAEGGSHSCCSYRGNGCSSCCYRGYMNADCCPCSKFTDTDSDGVMDLADPDSDADAIPDAEESTGDSDSDGVLDVLDAPADLDGDGVPDAEEGTGDSDSDGVPDAEDKNSCCPCDSDSDGMPNAEEGTGDSDSDGIPDGAERGTDGSSTSNPTSSPSSVLTSTPSTSPTSSPTSVLTSTLSTSPTSSPSSVLTSTPSTSPTSSPSSVLTSTPSTSPTSSPSSVLSPATDSDRDGVPDFLDPDSDGDGIDDVDEGADDPDSDGIPNHLDPDADGDGIDDAEEGTGDSDSDGVPDSFESDAADSDSDGIPDAADPKGTLLGASYCANSPNYDCYKGGWPSCCRRPGSCPESKPECEEVSNIKPTQPGCDLFASGEFAKKVAVRQCSKIELGPGDMCGSFAMPSKQCSDNGWPPPTHYHHTPEP